MATDVPSSTAGRRAAALRALVRRGTIAELSLAPDGTRKVAVVGGPSPSSVSGRVLGHIPFAVFREAQDAGWLVPADDEGVRWTLSAIARHHLRRIRSAGSGAPCGGEERPRPADGASASVSRPPPVLHDPAESPLGWLRRHRDKAGRPLISAMQLEAGERLRGDFWRASMSPRVTVNWSRIGGGGDGGRGAGGAEPGVDVRDSVAAAQQRVRRALTAVSPVSAGLLIDVCGHLIGIEEVERRRGWPVRSGKIALQMALAELARHYRLPGSEPRESDIAGRLRHWGAEGYRPVIEE